MLYNRTDHNSVNDANQFAEYIENDRFQVTKEKAVSYLKINETIGYTANEHCIADFIMLK